MASGYFADAISEIHPPTASTLAASRRGIAPYDIAGKESTLAQRPLFTWHGQQDAIVDVKYAERLREAICSGDFTCLIDPLSGHKITQQSVEAGIDFFHRVLPV